MARSLTSVIESPSNSLIRSRSRELPIHFLCMAQRIVDFYNRIGTV
uniref:Uncharacterized protein n=1 Tax=Arundo donax TaxID=35708 RepID=A0A0A8ZEG2_ARUDO